MVDYGSEFVKHELLNRLRSTMAVNVLITVIKLITATDLFILSVAYPK